MRMLGLKFGAPSPMGPSSGMRIVNRIRLDCAKTAYVNDRANASLVDEHKLVECRG